MFSCWKCCTALHQFSPTFIFFLCPRKKSIICSSFCPSCFCLWWCGQSERGQRHGRCSSSGRTACFLWGTHGCTSHSAGWFLSVSTKHDTASIWTQVSHKMFQIFYVKNTDNKQHNKPPESVLLLHLTWHSLACLFPLSLLLASQRCRSNIWETEGNILNLDYGHWKY